MKRLAKIFGALAVVVGLMFTTGCGSLIKTDQQTQALWYEDGEFSAQTFKGCVGAGVRERKDMGDVFYRYPIGDRTWSFTGRPGTDVDPLSVKTKDGQEMIVKGLIKFTLTDNCEALRRFHEKIGSNPNYRAYFNEDGSQSGGWVKFLNDYLAVPVNSIMDKAGMKENWQDLYRSAEAQDRFENDVQTSIKAEVDKTVGTPGVLNVGLVSIETPQPPEPLLKSLTDAEQNRLAATNAENKARADKIAEEAKTDLAAQQFKTVNECVKVLGQANCTAIEIQNGPNPPQWIPQGSQIHVQPK